MFDLVKAGGWLMAPIILCSIAAMAIIAERLWSLQRKRIAPEDLAVEVRLWVNGGTLTEERIQALQREAPLGRILAAALAGRSLDRQFMKEGVEDVGRHVAHELGALPRYARHHRSDHPAAGPAGHRHRDDQGVRGDHGAGHR